MKDLTTGRVEITAQNHGFAVDADSLPADCEITHINLNDNTVEGLRHRSLPVYSVQYHPEAGPGPHDPSHLFEEFVQSMEQVLRQQSTGYRVFRHDGVEFYYQAKACTLNARFDFTCASGVSFHQIAFASRSA